MRNLIRGKALRVALASAPVLALALIAMQPAQAQNFTVLYTFTGGADGATPLATPLLYNGNVYGTTSGGGNNNNGTVFVLNLKSHQEAALHTFKGAADGADPIGGLVQDKANDFYGVAYKGGAKSFGTLFKLNPDGTFTLLHSFAGPLSEGIGPAGTLVFDSRGDLFGTTYAGGGSKGWGTVFEYTAAGTFISGQNFSPDGALPRGGLYYNKGNLYGTTFGGGAHQYGGTIFQVGVQAALYTFSGGADGSQPLDRLLGDAYGNVYGTTSSGGIGNLGMGWGVVFKFKLSTGEETVLHTFTGSDGGVPVGGLNWDLQGNLYGTTSVGGAHGYGTVFKLDRSGNLTTLHDFTGGADGANPHAGVLVDRAGNVWGAAATGGSAAAPGGHGTLFIITPGTP